MTMPVTEYVRGKNICLAVMSEQTNGPDNQLLRPGEGSKCEPRIVHDPYPRVIDWGMPEDVNAGDFTFAVLEAALEVGASEIQLTPLEEFGEVSVHFRIGSEFIGQKPLTPIQFGFIAILLAHIATLPRHVSESPRLIRYFYTQDHKRYYVRFSKIRVGDHATAILIGLFLTQEATESAA
jgi:hypothetical protein